MQLDKDFRVLRTIPNKDILNYDLSNVAWNSIIKQHFMHPDSLSYQILKTDFSRLDAEVIVQEKDSALTSLVIQEISKLESELNAKAKMAVLVLLPAGASVKPHSAKSEFFTKSHCCHLPLLTNNDCLFKFEGNEYHLQKGAWSEINNLITNSITNRGSTTRIHLVVNLLPN